MTVIYIFVCFTLSVLIYSLYFRYSTKKSKKLNIVLIVLASIIGVVLLSFSAFALFFAKKTEKEILIPDVSGLSIVDAEEKLKKEGLEKQQFERIKKKIYGDYITEYNDISGVARMLMADYFKGINSFDYLETYKQITKEYAKQILNDVFKEENTIISVVEPKDKTN